MTGTQFPSAFRLTNLSASWLWGWAKSIKDWTSRQWYGDPRSKPGRTAWMEWLLKEHGQEKIYSIARKSPSAFSEANRYRTVIGPNRYNSVITSTTVFWLAAQQVTQDEDTLRQLLSQFVAIDTQQELERVIDENLALAFQALDQEVLTLLTVDDSSQPHNRQQLKQSFIPAEVRLQSAASMLSTIANTISPDQARPVTARTLRHEYAGDISRSGLPPEQTRDAFQERILTNMRERHIPEPPEPALSEILQATYAQALQLYQEFWQEGHGITFEASTDYATEIGSSITNPSNQHEHILVQFASADSPVPEPGIPIQQSGTTYTIAIGDTVLPDISLETVTEILKQIHEWYLDWKENTDLKKPDN